MNFNMQQFWLFLYKWNTFCWQIGNTYSVDSDICVLFKKIGFVGISRVLKIKLRDLVYDSNHANVMCDGVTM